MVNINTQIKNTKPKKLLPLTSDVIFKAVFSRPGNEDVLKALLEAILNVKIKKVVVQNPELPIDFSDSKAGVMDIKVTVDDNTVCGIEMQVKNLGDIDSRSAYYLSKTLASEVKRGEDYSQVKKAISIKLVNINTQIKNTKPKKLLPLTSDVIFKAVFSRPGNEDVLKALLEAILNVKIKKVVVQNPELPIDFSDSKAGVMDIKVTVDDNTVCGIEMQVKNLGDIDSRSAYYLSKTLASEVKRGEDYSQVKKAISINFLDFEFYKRNSYRSIAHMKFEKTKESEFVDLGYAQEDEMATKNLEMHFIELPKFIKKVTIPESELEQWLWLIVGKGGNMVGLEERVKEIAIEMHFIELPKFIKKVTIPESELEQWLWLIVGKGGNMVGLEERVKEIAKAEETLKELSMDKEAWYLYEARDMAKRDYNTGMKNAEQRGWNNGILEGEKRGLKELSMDKEAWYLYEARDMAKRDYNTGMKNAEQRGWNNGILEGEKRGEKRGEKIGEKIGEQRGEKKSKLEVAKKMLKKKIPVLDIIEFTGLSKEELAEIK